MCTPKTSLMVILTAVFLISASSKLSAGSADSIIFQNDSTFTIEDVQTELQSDGEWIKVTKAEVDPEGVTDGGGFDDEINTDYVWRPRNMDPGWNPYSNGYWSYTNCGWMWTSYYSWGWRTSHYGRWWWSEYYGWVWSPGFIWAPAWVVWMFNDGYCGWYPISPRVRRHHDYGYRCHHMRYRVRHWNFCEKSNFHEPLHPPVVIIDPVYNNQNIITCRVDAVISVGNSTVTNKGPDVKEIEAASKTTINKEDVKKYNNVDKITGENTKDKNTEKNSVEKNTDKKTEGRSNEKTYNEKKNNENEVNGKKTEEKTIEKTREKTKEQTKEQTKEETKQETKKEKKLEKKKESEKRNYEKKNDDSYENEKKSDEGYKEDKQNNDESKSDDRSDEKKSDDKHSNDNKQDSKPPGNDNDKGNKKNNRND